MTPVEESNKILNLFKTTARLSVVLGTISKSTLNLLNSRELLLRNLVDGFDINGSAGDLKVLHFNQKEAHNILCVLDEKIHFGKIIEYEYTSS